MSAPRIEIVIDELVLRGIAPEEAPGVGAAIESQLTAAAERWAVSDRAAVVAREESLCRLPAIHAPAASPAALGASVAGAVFDDLTGGAGR